MTAATLTGPKLQFKEFQARLLTKDVADGEEDYIREVLVAVTGNTDDGGDVINPGAFFFKRSPKIVWSHDLKTLVAKVLAYEEWKPGDARLPADLKAKGLGALWFKVEFDPLDPESFKAFRKVVFHEDLGWSIGYETDPKGFKMLPDGRRLLTKIYVWEGSPTTFGMNQEARTLSAKSVIQSTVEGLELSEEKAQAVQDLIATLVQPDEAKSYPALEGSFEETQDYLRTALREYGNEVYGEVSAENDWWVSIEGTFDDAVVASFRFYSGQSENTTLRFPYTAGDGGESLLGTPEEVEVTATVTPTTGTATPPADDTEAAMEAAALELEDIDGKSVQDAMDEVKKGAVLSAANATTLRNAQEAIAKVLAAADKEASDAEADKKKKPPKMKDDEKTARKVVSKEAPDLEGKELVTDADLVLMTALAES